MASTALDLISASMRLAGVLASGESLPNNEANDAFKAFNRMLDTWSNESLLIYVKAYETFPLVVNQQSYQMGATAADWVTARPQKIEDINFQQISGTTSLELPIQIINQDQWANISIKLITSNIPTHMWPQDTFPNSTLWFWPVPLVASNVIIWSWKPFTDITSLTTSISLPPGYEEMIIYNFAPRIAAEYGKTLAPEIIAYAVSTKAGIKRMNSKTQILGVDQALMPKKSTWNWYTGE